MIKEISFDESEAFEGIIEMEIGSFRQRLKDLSKIGVKFNTSGEIDLSNENSLETYIKMCDVVHSKIKTVKIKHKESGLEFDSLDKLEEYSEYQLIITKLINAFNVGASLGNLQDPKSEIK